MGCISGKQEGRSSRTGPDLHFRWWGSHKSPRPLPRLGSGKGSERSPTENRLFTNSALQEGTAFANGFDTTDEPRRGPTGPLAGQPKVLLDI